MASFKTPSPSNEEKFFPISLSAVNVNNFVSSKLRGDKQSNNYSSWKQQMLCLIESHDLRSFIFDNPESTAACASAFQRTDMLLKGWILGALSDPVLDAVTNSLCATARDVWLELEKNFISESAEPANVSSQTHSAASPDQVEEAQSSRVANEQYIKETSQLYRAALEGNWEAAKCIFDKDRRLLNTRLDGEDKVLHIAIGAGKKAINFVQKSVAMMSDDELAVQDRFSHTVLSFAAMVGNKAAATILVNRMHRLLYIPNNFDQFPIHLAARCNHRDVLEYLMSVPKKDEEPILYTGLHGLMLLKDVIYAEFFDIALDLVDKCPSLATLKALDDTSALEGITEKMSGLMNRRQLKFCRSSIFFASEVGMTMRPYEQALKLVKRLCKQMESEASSQTRNICSNAILKAAKLGVHEVVKAIVEINPGAIYDTSGDSEQYIFHIAVENRCEGVFNLICQMGIHKHLFTHLLDFKGNNVLHLAGKLAPPDKLNQISGAALQMQRELQWFKEVEKLVLPFSGEKMNNDKKTPKTLFTEAHKELKKDGEKWMKATANSYTIAATLIATVMFAAAITVPGGNESNTGFPIFSKEMAFTTFAYADAVSLFTSTTSLLMFLSILTSRYAEEDFLRALPKRLIIGLSTLFISITCMLISFAATVYLLFGQKNAWVLIPVAALACLPVTSFVLLQFPLLVELIYSTYCPGIFGKKSNRPFY